MEKKDRVSLTGPTDRRLPSERAESGAAARRPVSASPAPLGREFAKEVIIISLNLSCSLQKKVPLY